MAYMSFQNCTKQEYDNILYNQSDVNKCKLYFNDVEIETLTGKEADDLLEKITFIGRVLPENGKKIFSLDNFICEEVEIVIHDIDTSIIQDKVKIELGTLIDKSNDVWEYVPMGIYNIQDKPTRNDDKITIKLRDNAVLFDFNYNAKPLIDLHGGVATKKQILQDMCNQANVVCKVNSFLGEDDEVGYYDSTIKARQYVYSLAENAGCFPRADRDGGLIFVPINNLYIHRIPLSVVSKYIKGTTYTIERIVYELGTIKFETSNDETLQTLYISSENPFVEAQSQIDELFLLVDGFELDTVEILSDIIGNPSIDGYDLIQVYDDESENDVVVFTTLANNTLTYNGKFKSKYKTEIGLEERKENVTNTGEAVFRKNISSEIDRTNNRITTEVSETKTYTNDQISTLDSTLQGRINSVDEDLQGYKNDVSTTITQTASDLTIQFNNSIQGVSDTEKAHHDELTKYIRFVNGVIVLGEEGSEATRMTVELSNNRLSFKQGGNEVAYMSNNKLYITDSEMLENLIIGNFAFIPRSNGSLSFRKVR